MKKLSFSENRAVVEPVVFNGKKSYRIATRWQTNKTAMERLNDIIKSHRCRFSPSNKCWVLLDKDEYKPLITDLTKYFGKSKLETTEIDEIDDITDTGIALVKKKEVAKSIKKIGPGHIIDKIIETSKRVEDGSIIYDLTLDQIDQLSLHLNTLMSVITPIIENARIQRSENKPKKSKKKSEEKEEESEDEIDENSLFKQCKKTS